MLKYTYRPRRVDFGLSFLFFLGISYVSLLSTQVHLKNDNIYSFLTTTTLTVLASTFLYGSLTSIHYVYFLLRRKYINKTNPTVHGIKHTDAYTVIKLLLTQPLDFENSHLQRTIFISREQLWRILYVIPFLMYTIFYIVPIYDSTSTILFCCGMFIKSTHDELKKQYYWERPVYRKVINILIIITGSVSYVIIFVLCLLLSNTATNVGWAKTFDLDYFFGNTSSVDEDAYFLDTNSSTLNQTMVDYANTSARLDSDIMQYYMDMKKHEQIEDTPVLAQYLTWSQNSYFTKMIIPFLFSFFVPWTFDNIPNSISSLIVIEMLQIPLTALSCVVMCIVSVATQTVPFSLLKSNTGLGDLFFLTAGPVIWFCVFIIITVVKEKNTNSLAYIIAPFAFFKIIAQHYDVVMQGGNREIFFCCIVFYIGYWTLSIFYDREENKAMRGGWGTDDDEDKEFDEFIDDGHDKLTHTLREHQEADDCDT